MKTNLRLALAFVAVGLSGCDYYIDRPERHDGADLFAGNATDAGTMVDPADAGRRVEASAPLFHLGGWITGLHGSGLVLANGGELAPVAADGTFAFADKSQGTPYEITVRTSPVVPTQHCDVTAGVGAMPAADVAIAVACTTSAFTIGGTVTHLSGTGLVLTNEGADDYAVTSGTFTFATPADSGEHFKVEVKTQPSGPTQTCTVGGGEGLVGGEKVDGVVVDCSTTKFLVGGRVNGLLGSGLVLQNNGGDDRAVTASTFAFPTAIDSGAHYHASILTQPTNPSQHCVLDHEEGDVGAILVDTIGVTCTTNTYPVRVHVAGVVGTGLTITNGTDVIHPTADDTYVISAAIPSNGAFDVEVTGQPAAPTQACTVRVGNSGAVTDAAVDTYVDCVTQSFVIRGTVTGLLTSAVTFANGAESITQAADGSFAFLTKVASGSPYDVHVTTQPTDVTCVVTNGSATVGAGDVANVAIVCNPFVNGSFEDGFTGWGITETIGSTNWGGSSIIASGTTLASGSTMTDGSGGGTITIQTPSSATPVTFTSLSGTGNLAVLYSANGPSRNIVSQVVSIGATTTKLDFAVQYSSGITMDSARQYAKVTLHDATTHALLATLWQAGAGAPLSMPMTAFSIDVSTYQNQMVEVELEENGQNFPLFVAFDALSTH